MFIICRLVANNKVKVKVKTSSFNLSYYKHFINVQKSIIGSQKPPLKRIRQGPQRVFLIQLQDYIIRAYISQILEIKTTTHKCIV